ncbi:ABC transporter substrate-binding protein [Caloramator quimbayensis]|nr:ABC transporter substrate-binding protein [Caloramator quimbayensis]
MLKRNFAKVLAVVMILSTMLIGLTSCGKSAETQAQKEIEIKFPSFWVAKDSKAKVMSELINQFNEQNKGKIKVVVEEIADYDAYEDKMKSNIAAGTMPDVFIFKTGAMAEPYYKSGKLMDLTQYYNDGWKNDFLPGVLDSVTYNGQMLAVPYEYGVAPALYNKKLLAEAGYDHFPKTYTEFFDMCEKMKAKNIVPAAQMTGANAWTSMLWYSQLVVAIGGPDVYKNGLDDPAFLEAAKMMQKLFKYTTGDAVGATAAVTAGHFLNERVAILLNGPWFIGRIKNEGINNMYDNVEVAPAPLYEGGKGSEGGYIGFVQSNIGAAKQTDKNKEKAVVEFLKYLTKPENVEKLSVDSGSLFVVKTNLKPKDGKVERLQGEMIEQMNKAPYLVPHFQLMVSPSVGTEFPQALSSLVLGEKTPEQFIEALKAADKK